MGGVVGVLLHRDSAAGVLSTNPALPPGTLLLPCLSPQNPVGMPPQVVVPLFPLPAASVCELLQGWGPGFVMLSALSGK